MGAVSTELAVSIPEWGHEFGRALPFALLSFVRTASVREREVLLAFAGLIHLHSLASRKRLLASAASARGLGAIRGEAPKGQPRRTTQRGRYAHVKHRRANIVTTATLFFYACTLP